MELMILRCHVDPFAALLIHCVRSLSGEKPTAEELAALRAVIDSARHAQNGGQVQNGSHAQNGGHAPNGGHAQDGGHGH